jgi:hypothetical protein
VFETKMRLRWLPTVRPIDSHGFDPQKVRPLVMSYLGKKSSKIQIGRVPIKPVRRAKVWCARNFFALGQTRRWPRILVMSGFPLIGKSLLARLLHRPAPNSAEMIIGRDAKTVRASLSNGVEIFRGRLRPVFSIKVSLRRLLV